MNIHGQRIQLGGMVVGIALSVSLAGCAAATGSSTETLMPATHAPVVQPTETATLQPPTATHTIQPTPTATETPRPTTVPATLTASAPTQNPATRPVAGIVTPAQATSAATLAYEPVAGIPAEVAAWDIYRVRYVDFAVPIPPGWIVQEWPGSEATLFFYTVSIQPPLWDEPAECGFQCPEIGLAVWRVPAIAGLREWLALHGTKDPFGTVVEDNPYIAFYGVEDIEDTMMGSQPALSFYHDAMGIRVYVVITEVDGVVISLSRTHDGQFEFEPVFGLMRENAFSTP